jgi:hypothetical protein
MVRFGTSAITRAEYEAAFHHFEAQAVIGTGYKPGLKYFDPPRFRLCVQSRLAHAVGVERRLTAAEQRDRCSRHYAGLRQQTLQFLIESEWIGTEARKQRIEVPEELNQDATARVARQLFDRAAERGRSPTQHQVAAYYHGHRQEFWRREHRAALAMVTDSKQAASAAVQALREAKPWSSVARQYDFRHDSNKISAFAGDRQDLVRSVVLHSRLGEVKGPIETPEGWYVLKVTRIAPPRMVSLTSVSPFIARYLEARSRYLAGAAFMRRFSWAARTHTTCLSGLKVPDCHNGPADGFDRQSLTPIPPGRPQLRGTAAW